MTALIWSPFANEEQVKQATAILLDEKLIACANIVPGMKSIFAWEGQVQESQECGALFKTDSACLGRAVARLTQLHPYDQPAILGWQCDAAPPATQEWLAALGE